MRVFVTGASGFIGSAVVEELLAAGHDVVGLARSDEAARALADAGAEVHRGSLEEPESLGAAAAAADGVIHTAYIHDFSRIEHSVQTDLRAIETLGAALEGSDRPLVVTCGTALVGPGRVVTEEDFPPLGAASHSRSGCERAALALSARGVRSSVVRPAPSVHGAGDHGFIPFIIAVARAKGVSGYVDDGTNRWPAVHRLDTARLYRLALEQAPAGSVLHAVADEGVPTREIAEVIGRHLELPVASIPGADADEHFGWIGRFWGLDAPASNALTRRRMGWEPTHPGLLADLEEGHYFERSAVTAS
jgi:nucleoside-diphosphate-sugar epimerase